MYDARWGYFVNADYRSVTVAVLLAALKGDGGPAYARLREGRTGLAAPQ
jgi:hypothetical protein